MQRRMNRRGFIGVMRLFRPELPFSAGICVVLGELLALGGIPPLWEMLLGFFSYFFISATALILNDYFDLEIDRVNAPHRPLPSGIVAPRDVVNLSIVVAGLGIILSALVSVLALVLVIVVWAVGVAYNWRFKRTGLPGNLMVSFSVGSTFVFGGIVVGHPGDVIVWWFGALAFLVDLGEEIAADAMDMEGDALIGSRSLGIVLGQRAALRISAAIFGLAVIVSLLPFVFGWLEPAYAIPLVVMDAVIVYSVVRILRSHTERRRLYIRWIYLGATAAILAMIVLRLTTG
jgi:geranylgeranylglycerol-phosphate geranylgeranyltransferase